MTSRTATASRGSRLPHCAGLASHLEHIPVGDAADVLFAEDRAKLLPHIGPVAVTGGRPPPDQLTFQTCLVRRGHLSAD